MGKELVPNYTAVREELSSGGCLNGECLEAFLSIGLEYTSDLIKEKKSALFGLERQTEGFRKYLTEAVLWRMINMYNRAVKDGIEKADSITLFEKLRDTACERISLPKESLSEDLLSSLFIKGLDSFYNNDPSPEVMVRMNLISRFASGIVPNNPPKAVKTDRFITD